MTALAMHNAVPSRTPENKGTPNRCFGTTIASTPPKTMTRPPAPCSGAAALLATANASSLRIVDDVRTPATQLRESLPRQLATASHTTGQITANHAIRGM
jgi:hypothetical protein